MKYSLLMNLDSSDLLIFDGSRLVGTLAQQNNAFALTVNQGSADEFSEVADSMRYYTQNIGTSLVSLANDLTRRRRALDVIGQIAPPARARIHLGCGPDVRPNWLNVDFRPDSPELYRAQDNFLNWDLRVGLALPDASADVIYSSHFFEHLTLDETKNLLKDCRRVLKPAGRFRAMLPDFRRAFAAYVNDDAEFFRRSIEDWHLLDFLPSDQRGKMDVLSRCVHEFYTHKYLYDADNFSSLLIAAGFTDIQDAPHEETIDNNEPIRVQNSFYVDARRPA